MSAQKKDSAKEQVRAAKPVSKPDTNRKKTAAGATTKKPAKQPATSGKTEKAGTVPAGNKTKTAQQPVSSRSGKTGSQKDTVRKKDTAVKAAVRPTAKKDSSVAKKIVHPPKAVVKRDSVRRTAASQGIPPAVARDSTRIKAAIADSLRKVQQLAVQERNYNLTRQILTKHPYYRFTNTPAVSPYSKRIKQPGEEIYFYTLAGIMLLFAGFKTAFSKYFDDLTTLFFRRTLKQRQLQQQLSQNTLPSFLFNILFVFVAGYYLALMAEQLATKTLAYPFWQLFSFALVVVSAAYLAKFFLLKLFGWLFKLQHLTDAYIFLIFLVNKILVLFLLPVIVITALGGTGIKTIIWTLSWLIVAALFLYRFTVALQMVQKSNKISLFHFFIYFIAFELLPAFVIYKFILHFLTQNSVPLHPI